MSSAVLTDGAVFTCAHGGTGSVVTPVAAGITVAGHKPILTGATVTGFATCTFATAVGPLPCASFALPPASGIALTAGGVAVYTMADANAIKAVPSTGNAQPGLTVLEAQTFLTA